MTLILSFGVIATLLMTEANAIAAVYDRRVKTKAVNPNVP
jgi:hypothetical protein